MSTRAEAAERHEAREASQPAGHRAGDPSTVEGFLGRCLLMDDAKARHEEKGLPWPELEEEWAMFQARRREVERARR